MLFDNDAGGLKGLTKNGVASRVFFPFTYKRKITQAVI